jgi:hypothetical protein
MSLDVGMLIGDSRYFLRDVGFTMSVKGATTEVL